MDPSAPIALRSTRVVLPDGVRPATLLLAGGRFEAILPHDAAQNAPIEELGHKVVMAGLVDTHVHINEPGRTEWEGFESATAAAAMGGVTSLVDMPLNCLPVTTTPEAFERKLDASRPKLSVDVGFWGGVVPGNQGSLPDLAKLGILGAKCFLVHSGIEEFPNLSRDELRAAMPVLRDAGLPLLVHAELDLGAPPSELPPQDYGSWLHSRPQAWEVEAIRLVIELCRETGCPAHIVHLSASDALPLLAEARAEGLPITVETCPHYLCLNAEDVPLGATWFKCAPPIREQANKEALWRGLADGVIDFVVTDHSPCVPELKCIEEQDFLAAWGGIASLQLGLPSIWTAAAARGFAIADIARWLCAEPARFAGLSDRKGSIEPGKDADLVIWDPEARFTVRAEDLCFRHKISPFIGRAMLGKVSATWLRGRKIVEQGRALAPGLGRHLLHREHP